jgi:hypothetical protein
MRISVSPPGTGTIPNLAAHLAEPSEVEYATPEGGEPRFSCARPLWRHIATRLSACGNWAASALREAYQVILNAAQQTRLTLRSRLNGLEMGAIIIVMQRLHADDLVVLPAKKLSFALAQGSVCASNGEL